MNSEKSGNFEPQDPFFMEKYLSEKSMGTICPRIIRVNGVLKVYRTLNFLETGGGGLLKSLLDQI